jgi:hypothetical protein
MTFSPYIKFKIVIGTELVEHVSNLNYFGYSNSYLKSEYANTIYKNQNL